MKWGQEHVDQLRAVVNESGKFVWSVLIACFGVLIVEHYDPSYFLGLPGWILPSIRVAAIFFMVLAGFSTLIWIWNWGVRICVVLAAPMNKRQIRKRLLGLNALELVVISKAHAATERIVWAKSDLEIIISLEDKKLLARVFLMVATGDGTSSFEIPLDVWRVILRMKEFKLRDSNALLRTLSSRFDEEQLVDLLPQMHPAIIKYQSKK